MNNRKKFFVFVLASFACCWSHAAQAQSSDYRYQVTPYVFTTGVNGVIGEQGRTADVDASFGDVLHHLNMTATFSFEARFGRWRALVDNLYLNVSDARATPGPLFLNAKVATKVWIVDPEVGYAIVQRENKEFDVTAGVRIWNLNNTVTLVRSETELARGSGTRSLPDPVVGARFSSDLGKKMFVFGKADVGGFHAGASMDWQAFAGGGYKFSDRILGSIGYRYLSVDYSPDDSVFDVHLNGVILGLGFRF